MATSCATAGAGDVLRHEPEIRYQIPQDSETFLPYDHQVQAWDLLSNHFEQHEGKAGIVVIPTGGGKTATAVRWLLKRWVSRKGRVLWLAHRQSLLWQAHKAFRKACRDASPDRDVLGQIVVSGVDRSWSNVSPEHDIVLSTVQTASSGSNIGFVDLMAKQSAHGLFVVVDEAHHASSRSYQRLLVKLKDELGCPLMGLTATPMRMDADDNRRLWKTFDHTVLLEVKKQHLIHRDILAHPIPRTVRTNVAFEREFTEADLTHLARFGELSSAVLERIAGHSGRNQKIVEHYREHRASYGKTLVFAADTLHARTLTMEFCRAGIAADYVDYTRGKDNRAVLESFASADEPAVLCNVEMLTEGVDLPNTQTVFLVRPTRSEALLNQMIGRALRGVQAGGTREAYLVTFVDTWEHFDPLELSIVIDHHEAAEAEVCERLPFKIVVVSDELVREAYRLVKSVSKGTFEGHYECLPHSWYVWEAEYDDDLQQRSILVFENQVKGFELLDADFESSDDIPEVITELFAMDVVQRCFGDAPDPLPSWTAIAELLEARRRGAEIHHYTFDEKAQFDPNALARSIQERNLGERDKSDELSVIFDENPICAHVYQGDRQAFFEDVDRALNRLRDHRVPATPELVALVPEAPRRWESGEQGYELTEIGADVASNKQHFAKKAPRIGDIRYMVRPDRMFFGFFRASDRVVQIHPALNSPDVPLFALEFLVYHELLHADMPEAQHNRDFRRRERKFAPSEKARADAAARGYEPAATRDGWRVLADQFFDTFDNKFTMDGRGRGRRI